MSGDPFTESERSRVKRVDSLPYTFQDRRISLTLVIFSTLCGSDVYTCVYSIYMGVRVYTVAY